MAVKKRCVGCGRPYDYYGGKSFICPACGEENNPSLTAELEDIFLNAENLRRNGDFEKAYNEYQRCIEDNDEFAEAYWGSFLSEYRVKKEDDVLSGDFFPCTNRETVQDNINYVKAIDKDPFNVEKKEIIGSFIERARTATTYALQAVKNNKYNVVLLSDTTRAGSLIADELYDYLKDRLNVFYAPRSIVTNDDYMREALEYSACRSVSLCFAVFDGIRSGDHFKKHCLHFIKNHKPFMFNAICNDSDEIPPEITCNQIIAVDDGLKENVLSQIRIMGVFSLEEKESLRENGRILSGGETSKKIVV